MSFYVRRASRRDHSASIAFGGRLAEDVSALEMDAICPDDTVLHIEAGGGALLFADSLIHYDEVGFVSDKLIGDDPELVNTAFASEPRRSLSRTSNTSSSLTAIRCSAAGARRSRRSP